MLILIVEDDPAIVRFLERGLGAHGHSTMTAGDGEEGVRLAAEESVEMVLLDVMLPRLDGQQALQRIRLRRPNLPVLMLTARDEVHHKVNALDSGADDYLTKPFDLEELLARMRALTRRSDQPWSSKMAFGDLSVDLRSRRVRRGEKQVDLSSREFALLEYFMRHPGQVVSRQQILSAVWDYAFDPGSNVVDVYVRYLRSKLDRRGDPSVIETVRGAGYRFEPPADAHDS
ncbi:MAG: response regulator in two-component regulatory system with PhoQ [uncultured Rubrobacteraceae bacterium]|uniref:Response regulator in two-component regulatory system with PhoQ n=1 Tax=uncultured Rubrobacteraceae bacterium TaxID=349277 RepID=A0A6J4P9U4_9ACTN|nr:MAG: response regulator in two-component regulatory system with PhoQ [uncultured Rubrobacteraceae bacterium]